MALELWGLDDLREKRKWLQDKADEYNRLQAVYEAVQTQKDIYNTTVKDARKNVFKDGWLKGKYDWVGSTYTDFEAFGTGDLKDEVDRYYRNRANGLDDVADALNDAKSRITQEINDVFLEKFGPLNTIADLLTKVGTEIQNLLN